MVRSLLAREGELASLDAALASTDARVRGILVTGEAGIGKTALTDVFLDRAADRGAMALRCSGLLTTGREVPFPPVVQLLRHLRADHRSLLLQLLGPQSRDVLRGLVPDLVPGTRKPGSQTRGPGPTRALLLIVLADLILDLATCSRVVLRVDDLHWVDAGTLSLLELLLRSGDRARLLLVLGLREPVESPSVRHWCAAQLSAGTMTTVAVPALDLVSTGRLLSELPSCRAQARTGPGRAGPGRGDVPPHRRQSLPRSRAGQRSRRIAARERPGRRGSGGGAVAAPDGLSWRSSPWPAGVSSTGCSATSWVRPARRRARWLRCRSRYCSTMTAATASATTSPGRQCSTLCLPPSTWSCMLGSPRRSLSDGRRPAPPACSRARSAGSTTRRACGPSRVSGTSGPQPPPSRLVPTPRRTTTCARPWRRP